jgi:hypothetical protein
MSPDASPGFWLNMGSEKLGLVGDVHQDASVLD